MVARATKQRRTIRFKTSRTIGGLPLVSIAFGPDPSAKESIGIARGVIAIGDVATGVIAIGGIAGGGVAIGGISLGGLALGGVTLGGLILGGVSIGVIACGGVAVGHYARGGAVVGTYAVGVHRRDAEAVRLFEAISPGSLPATTEAADKK